MASTLGVYNPIFYAQEALILVEKALGIAARIHRGYDDERRSFGKGSVVSIRKPETFTAANAPATAVELTTETVNITLDQWKEVKFKLTDKELTYTQQRIIDDHIRPAAYALADNIDQALAAEYVNVPWFYDISGTPVVADITGVRKILFDNAVPLDDPSRIHYMIDSAFEAGLLGLSAFSQHQGAGDTGVSTQLRGTLGTKFGAEVFANQNTPSHTAGTCADATGALTADASAGATSIAIDAVTDGGTWKIGDTFVIAGNTQRYAVTADVTFTGGSGTVSCYPALVVDYSDNDVVTGRVDSHTANLMFHRNAFALVTAPLSMIGNELGAKIATVQDPVTGLSLRSRLYYVGNSSEVHVAIDVLYGVQTLDGNLACRGCG